MISDGEDGTDSKKYSTVRTYRPLNLCVLVGYFYLLKQGLLFSSGLHTHYKLSSTSGNTNGISNACHFSGLIWVSGVLVIRFSLVNLKDHRLGFLRQGL